jgi:hypothetical protein
MVLALWQLKRQFDRSGALQDAGFVKFFTINCNRFILNFYFCRMFKKGSAYNRQFFLLFVVVLSAAFFSLHHILNTGSHSYGKADYISQGKILDHSEKKTPEFYYLNDYKVKKRSNERLQPNEFCCFTPYFPLKHWCSSFEFSLYQSFLHSFFFSNYSLRGPPEVVFLG